CAILLDAAKEIDPAGESEAIREKRRLAIEKMGLQAPVPIDVASVREEALRACQEKRWAAWLEGLNKAREADPSGGSEPEGTAARNRAVLALEKESGRGGGRMVPVSGTEVPEKGPRVPKKP